MIAAFTGHRPNKFNNDYDLVSPWMSRIRDEMVRVIRENKITHVIVGMALGGDTLMAQVCITLGIPFTAAIPFKGQEKAWPLKSQELYHNILKKAINVVIVCEGGYAPWKMQRRNEWMVDHSVALIALWDGTKGGTENCIKYAQNKTEIFRINPQDFK